MDRNLSPRNFDPAADYVAARTMLVDGHELHRGTRLPMGEDEGQVKPGNVLRLWMCGWVIKATDYHPTPVEGDVDPAQIVVDDTVVEKAVADFNNGTVTDATAVIAVVTDAQPATNHTVDVVALGGGFYTLTPSWDAEAVEKVRGKAAADARVAELLASAPVAGAQEATEDAPEQSGQPDPQEGDAEQPEGTQEGADAEPAAPTE